MAGHRIYAVPFASIHPAYVAKAERKGRTRDEVDVIIRWLTGHSQDSLEAELARGTRVEDFFAQAPGLNEARSRVTGVVCGVRVETIEEPTMRLVRILDKLIDELAKGRPLNRILRA